MGWSKNGTPSTLSSNGDTLEITDLTASKFNQFMFFGIPSGSTAYGHLRFNADSTSVYAQRYSSNGGADSTNTSISNIYGNADSASVPQFDIWYVNSISGEEKLVIGFLMDSNTAGAGNAPNRREIVGKYVPSPDADITAVEQDNQGTSDWASGTNLTALNGDTTEELILGNVQSGSRFEATDTRKIYYGVLPTATLNTSFTSNTGWSESDSSKNTVNTSLGRIDFDLRRDTSVDSMAYDFGSALSDTAWLVRFKIHIDNVYNVDASALRVFIGMSDGNHTQHHAVSQDAIGMFIIHSISSDERDWRSCWSNGASTESNLVELGTQLNDARNGYDSYIEIKRTSSSTAQVSVSSTNAFDGDIASNSITGISGVTGLRYFAIKNTDTSYSSTTNRTDGWIDDLVIYDGVSSPDFAWTEEA